MLVHLGKAVLPRRLVQRIHVLRLVLRNHLFSAAGVTGERKTGQADIFFQKSGGDQRCYQGDETGGVTAGVGDTLCCYQLLPQAGQFRHAVHPVL